jgi:hypothetical protein
MTAATIRAAAVDFRDGTVVAHWVISTDAIVGVALMVSSGCRWAGGLNGNPRRRRAVVDETVVEVRRSCAHHALMVTGSHRGSTLIHAAASTAPK